MAKVCPICGKGGITAGRYSNRVRATQFNPTGKKRKQPNLQWARLPAPKRSDGGQASLPAGGRVKICTNCLKKDRHLTEKIKT